jgi:hypothetical protein
MRSWYLPFFPRGDAEQFHDLLSEQAGSRLFPHRFILDLFIFVFREA